MTDENYGLNLSPDGTTPPTMRERLKDGAPVVTVTQKPAAKSRAIPAGLKPLAGGGDGPSRATYGNSEAAAMGAMLNGRFPSR